MGAADTWVLEDRKLGEQLRTDGRQWVEDRYDWRQVYHAWDDVYDQLVQG